MAEILYGRNAVREALRAQRRSFNRLVISSGAQENSVLAEITKLAEETGVISEKIDRKDLDRQLRDANHQGVALECGAYPYVEIEDCLKLAQQRAEQPFLLLLDHLQDPQNIGTLLRTAEVVGVHGVIMPGRRAAEITPAVVNASAGATEHLRIAVVTNLAQSIAEIQKAGVWVVGADEDERSQVYDQVDMDMPIGVVIGAEGTGLARLTREKCDFIVKLLMTGQIESLNAAVAGSILLYHAWRARAG